MATFPAQTQGDGRDARVGLFEALAYVGLLLAVVGGVSLIYGHDAGGNLVLDWWARALIESSYLVIAAAAWFVVKRGVASAARDRGIVTAVTVVIVALGVIAAEVLGGSGLLANNVQFTAPDGSAMGQTIDRSGAYAVAAAIVVVLATAALARWKNFLLVAVLVAADLTAVGEATSALKNINTSGVADPNLVALVLGGGGLLLLVVSLVPRLRSSDHAEFMRLVGAIVIGAALASAGPATGSASTSPWLTLVALGFGLACVLLATRKPMASRGLVAGGVVVTVAATMQLIPRLLGSSADSTLIGEIIGLIAGVVVFAGSAAALLLRGGKARVLEPLPPIVSPLSVAHPTDVATPGLAMSPVVATAPAYVEPVAAPAAVESDAAVAAAVVEEAAAPTPEEVVTPVVTAAEAPESAPVLIPEETAAPVPVAAPEVVPAAAEEPASAAETPAPVPDTAAATTPDVETPPAGVLISDDKHYWWDAAANTWKRVPVSPDGYYYFDGTAWQTRPT